MEIRGHEGPPPENFGIFELPRLDFLQFQHDFRSFLDKKGLLLRGPKPFSRGGGGGRGDNTGAGGAECRRRRVLWRPSPSGCQLRGLSTPS